MTSKTDTHDQKLDPREAEEDVRRYFEGVESSEIVARAEKMSPPSRTWEDGGTTLSQLATEVSWRLMLSADDPTSMDPKEAAQDGLEFFARFDDTIAFIGASRSAVAPDVDRLGYGTRRFLVSQTSGLKPVLTRLVESDAYVSLRRILESIASSSTPPDRRILEDARKGFAGLAVILEEAAA